MKRAPYCADRTTGTAERASLGCLAAASVIAVFPGWVIAQF